MEGVHGRPSRLAGPLFFLSVGCWECFTLFNQSGEPWPLSGLPLVCWAITTRGEALAIAWVMEHMLVRCSA
jgi:hypothetical protein